MHPLDLVGAAPWNRVVFTTYALSLSFVEAVILDRLVRGGGRGTIIFSDPEGVRAGLSEQGAARAGRDYELEPVVCSTGVFHPKLGLFFSDDDAHMLIGSGNLTFGGWGMNLEAVEHVHPSFAAEVFDDAADFFDLMAMSETIRCGAQGQFEEIASRLRLSAQGAPRRGDFRLLHSVGGSIGEQLAELAEGLGGAQKLTVVSPYFDVKGIAVAQLAEQLRCDDVSLHVHPSSPVRGPMGTNWPQATLANPVRIDDPFGRDGRHLHAKCFEILCRRGRLLMTGSANATLAALKSGNVEASLVRIQRNSFVAWSAVPCDPPVQLPEDAHEEGDDKARRIGVLRAELQGDQIQGVVMTPSLSGKARLFIVLTGGPVDLGEVLLEQNGRFEAIVPGLEASTWGAGRMVVRIEQGERSAEGFVSVASAVEINRIAGSMAPRLLAMLAGTETPEDVAAILTWFKGDAQGALQAASGARRGPAGQTQAPVWVTIEGLKLSASAAPPERTPGGWESPAWQRAMVLIRTAFSARRGPWTSGTDRDDQADQDEDRESEVERQRRLLNNLTANKKAVQALDALLDEMLATQHQGRHTAAAFALTRYVVDRVRPEGLLAAKWLYRIRSSISRLEIPDDAGLAASVLLEISAHAQDIAPETARRFLLRHAIDPNTFEIEMEAIQPFIDVLRPGWNGEAFLDQVRQARTAGEEVRAFLYAADEQGPRNGFERLEQSKYWPALSKVLADPARRARLLIVDSAEDFCPRCRQIMPTAFQQDLRVLGVTDHCRLILCRAI